MNLIELIETLLSNESACEEVILIAIQELEKNMFVKAKFYEGDLLMTILGVEEEYWKHNPKQWKSLIKILNSQEAKIIDQEVSFEMKVDWYAKIKRFKSFGV